MALLDSLLKVLVSNGGDELVLARGEAPAFFAAGRPLKLFLRELGADRHEAVLRELGGASEWDAGEHGTFRVTVRGAEGDRIRLYKGADEEPEEPEAPAPTAGTDALGVLLDYAAELGASDLHLATGEPAVLRTDGQLKPLGANVQDVEALLGPVLDDADRAELARGGSVDHAVRTPGGNRFRGNVYRCDRGLAAAFRVLRPEAPALAALDLPVALDWCVDFRHGLVLFCGPTGSGKSTTMAALAREALRRRRGMLLTLEDPVEYTFAPVPGSLVRQREIGRHVADFPTGLRDALREDPDLLLVGEMRDPESIQLALTAAETGHLVLASLHSRTAPSAIERIVDSYPPERQRQVRVQLADALRAVISQRLLPRASGAGRVPAVEVLKITPAAAHLIRDGKTPGLVSVMQTGGDEGMVPLDRCVQELVRRGRITPEVAREALQ